jgi:hypothetical protein
MKAGVMGKGMLEKEALLTGTGGASVRADRDGVSQLASKPTPEEGIRLMHAFCRIDGALAREAIIKYVEGQSALREEQ